MMKSKNNKLLLVVVAFAGIGVATVLATRAEKIFIMTDIDAGQKSGYAKVVKDKSAAGGKYIMFSKNAPTATTTNGNKSTSTGGGSSGGSSGSTGGSSGRCPAYPSFPNASCTGPTSASLPQYTGPHEITTDGATIQNVEIRTDFFRINANNVTIRNVRFIYTGAFEEAPAVVWVDSTTRKTTFQDCEIDGNLKAARGIAGDNGTTIVRNCNIHHVGNGIEVQNRISSLYEDNYLNEIMAPPGNPTDWHCDGIQSWSGDDNITIRHNTIYLHSPETGAINVSGPSPTTNLSTNVLIEKNLLAGGGYTMYVGPGDSTYRVLNNHFSTKFYPKVGYAGVWYYNNSEDGSIVRSGNVMHETGVSNNYEP